MFSINWQSVENGKYIIIFFEYVIIFLMLALLIISCIRLDEALDYEIDVTDKYSGSYFLEEIKGLADATGLDYKVHTCLFHLYLVIMIF